MVKQKVKLRITEVNRARRRVVGSTKSVLNEERQAAQAAVWAVSYTHLDVYKRQNLSTSGSASTFLARSKMNKEIVVIGGGAGGMMAAICAAPVSYTHLHTPYLDDFNAENGTHIVSVAAIHVEPMGLYGGKQTTLDALSAK